MSKPKKPGTDLAALKARLAKKTKGAEAAAPPAEAAPMADVPPPGQVAPPSAPMQMADVPPPGHVAPPSAPMQMADVPPPGHVSAPAPEVPPPGQPMMAQPEMQMQQPMAQPMAQPHAVPPQGPPMSTGHGDENPFGGGSAMGGFDPEAGLIDGGEIKPRGNKGIVLFAALLAAGIGAIGGWLGHKIISTGEKIDQGRAKGEKMVEQVEKISDARKSVSLAMEDLKKDIAQDPAGSADKVTALLTESFDKQPQVSELFGWQLASVDPAGVKASFQLYEQLNELQQNLGLLSNFLRNYGGIMKVGGPSLYGITVGPSGAQLVAISNALCGEVTGEGDPSPEALAALKPCDPSAAAKAVAYQINDLSGEPKVMLRGVGENRAMLLLAEGKVYEYAIGIEPGKNAANFYTMVMSRLNESLEAMDQAEEKALSALGKYAEDPNVDGPAPSAGDGEG